jgi:hypothetical protein
MKELGGGMVVVGCGWELVVTISTRGRVCPSDGTN